ncbi:MAG: hypothetical protein HY047_16970, partial [Acidobacteria bacterium]|nr:hypothetical protein [Acidobacteriota bacterium]
MAPPFAVFVTARFERDYRALLKRHSALATDYATVIDVLCTDPYNRTRQHAIKKLEEVAAGDGQYRMRSGRFRFRYDIDGSSVLVTKPQHVVLLVNEATRLSVVVPARHLSTLPTRFATGLKAVLTRLQIPEEVIAGEVREMRDVAFGTTASRSVLGTMNDYVHHIEWAF